MKIAVLSESGDGFIRPMALGLCKMLGQLNVTTVYFEKGLAMLDNKAFAGARNNGVNLVKRILNRLPGQYRPLRDTFTRDELDDFSQQLYSFDVVIVVCPLPRAFQRGQLRKIEQLRQTLKIPFVLYQNYYLETRGHWPQKLRQTGEFGLERYDWYLAASMVSDFPLHAGKHPVSVIGHDLSQEALFVDTRVKTEAKNFSVLLDFKRPGHEQYRKLQIQALERAGIPYTQLAGHYSREDINALYRSHCALFLSWRESFGLPIVENQLCGNLIFSPFAQWCPSHFINKPLNTSGIGALGDNFKVYNNDIETLVEQLIQSKRCYQPLQIRQRFVEDYPDFAGGNLDNLKEFLQQLQSGKIHYQSHLEYQL